MLKEPQYDAERIKTDLAYRYSKIDELTEYMNTVEPYEDRVRYYIKTTKELGYSVHTFCAGTKLVGARQYRLDRVTWKNLDEHGEVVPVKSWELKCTTNDEWIACRKIWFLELRHEVPVFSGFRHWKNEPLEQRKDRYFDQLKDWNSLEYAKRQLAAIELEIGRFMKEYIAYRNNEMSYDRYTDAEVKAQQEQAPELIESELLGNSAIRWRAFLLDRHLLPFGYLWDMVAFKLFLLQQIHAPTNNKEGIYLIEGYNESLAANPELSLPQVAYLFHYLESPITKNNCNEIARRFGHTSGQKLKEKYDQYASPLTRTAKGKYTVKNIEMVIPYLEGAALMKANKELKDARDNN